VLSRTDLSLALVSLNWSPPKLLTQGLMPPPPEAHTSNSTVGV
jgi:hypothetical protein